MRPLATIIYGLCALLLGMGALSIGMVLGEKIGMQKQVAPFIWTDPMTRQQYVANPAGGIWPRLDESGKQVKESGDE